MTDIKVKLMRLRVPPRKVRLVIDMLRGRETSYAESQLLYLPKRSADPIRKLILSGVSAAKQKGANPDKLWIKSIQASEGTTFRRQIPHFRGTALPQRRMTSHVFLTLSDEVRKGEERKAK
jgi:large subunit ribosomal protein L22